MNILEYQIYQHIIYCIWKQSKEYRNINDHPNLSHPVERLKSCAGPAVPLALTAACAAIPTKSPVRGFHRPTSWNNELASVLLEKSWLGLHQSPRSVSMVNPSWLLQSIRQNIEFTILSLSIYFSLIPFLRSMIHVKFIQSYTNWWVV